MNKIKILLISSLLLCFVIKSQSQSYLTDPKASFVPTTPYTPNFEAIGGMLHLAQSNYDEMIAKGYLFDEVTNQWYQQSELLNIYAKRQQEINNASILYSKTQYFLNNAEPKDGKHTVYLLNIEQQHPILYTSTAYVKKGSIKSMEIYQGNASYKPKSNKIFKGKVESYFVSGLFGSTRTPYFQVIFVDDDYNL